MMIIRATVTELGGDLVIVGLSHANLDRLRAHGLSGFIRIDKEKTGLSVDILITAAQNEQVMFKSLEEGLHAGTKPVSDKLKS